MEYCFYYLNKTNLKWQLENHEVVSKDNYHLLEEKYFYSGRPIRLGDQILKGLLYYKDSGIFFINRKLIKLHIDEINQVYELRTREAWDADINDINSKFGNPIIIKHTERSVDKENYIED